MIIQELEKILAPMKVHDFFDLIIGTSTGGIIASALSNGVPASKLPAMYKSRGADIFKPN